MSEKIRVGVIGLGMMGNTHLDVYAEMEDVEVVALADRNPIRLSGEEKAGGNIEGQAQGGFTSDAVERFTEGSQLIDKGEVDVVDVCVTTPSHLELAKAALERGKHVLVEKPLARTYAEAKELAHAGDHAQGFAMCAMCMRFWPGWVWLKQAVEEQRYGKLLGLSFRRVAQHPGGPFYSDGEAAGGAVLDLHIHDSDFVRHLLGEPDAVQTVGYSRKTSALDHVSTQYLYGADGPLVHAEGGWNMTDGFGFSMRYTANFERATADFDIGRDDWLHLSEDGSTKPVELPPGMGYEHEIRYFIDCIKAGQPPKRVSLADAAESVRLVEAEVRSAQAKGERASL